MDGVHFAAVPAPSLAHALPAGRGTEASVCVPNPFSGFFDGVGDEQRRSAEERAQGVADHVVRYSPSFTARC